MERQEFRLNWATIPVSLSPLNASLFERGSPTLPRAWSFRDQGIRLGRLCGTRHSDVFLAILINWSFPVSFLLTDLQTEISGEYLRFPRVISFRLGKLAKFWSTWVWLFVFVLSVWWRVERFASDLRVRCNIMDCHTFLWTFRYSLITDTRQKNPSLLLHYVGKFTNSYIRLILQTNPSNKLKCIAESLNLFAQTPAFQVESYLTQKQPSMKSVEKN